MVVKSNPIFSFNYRGISEGKEKKHYCLAKIKAPFNIVRKWDINEGGRMNSAKMQEKETGLSKQ